MLSATPSRNSGRQSWSISCHRHWTSWRPRVGANGVDSSRRAPLCCWSPRYSRAPLSGARFLSEQRPQVPASPSPSSPPLTEADVRNASIDLPEWQHASEPVAARPNCSARGKIRFTNGVAKAGATYVDLLVQRRDFRWSGSQFQQIAGETTFPATVRVPDIDPANWTYSIDRVGGGDGTQPLLAGPDCPLNQGFPINLFDGNGDGTVTRTPGTPCGRVNAVLVASVRGTLPKPGAVVLVTVRITIGADSYVAAYAIYDDGAGIQSEMLLPRYGASAVLEATNPRIANNGLEVTARTDWGEKTYRWQWKGQSDGANLHWSFELTP